MRGRHGLIFFFFPLAALGFEHEASHLLGRHFYHSTNPRYVLGSPQPLFLFLRILLQDFQYASPTPTPSQHICGRRNYLVIQGLTDPSLQSCSLGPVGPRLNRFEGAWVEAPFLSQW
jgi:hypothetical protein